MCRARPAHVAAAVDDCFTEIAPLLAEAVEEIVTCYDVPQDQDPSRLPIS
jgi:hypothetical protein